MPFELKNVRATFQRMVDQVFKDLIGHTMEVYADDILVKSVRSFDHLRHLSEAFDLLRKYQVKLNPEKCTFGVAFGKFLGYLVTQRGIEANPDQISAIQNMKSSMCVKEVQILNGCLAALNMFLSCSADKYKPFFQALKKNGAEIRLDEECAVAFQRLKRYLTSPPFLSKPVTGETLYLHLAVSKFAASRALVREDKLSRN